MAIAFVTADAFQPDGEPWRPVGPIASVEEEPGGFLLRLAEASLAIRLAVLSPSCLRVQFRPRPDLVANATSVAVVNRPRAAAVRVIERSPHTLVAASGALRFEVDLHAYALRVFRNGQLISADAPGRGVVYRPAEHGIACYKAQPAGAVYCGFGEKAGARLLQTGSLTNFNFDNFMYARAPIPAGSEAGPLNPAEPLYASIPLLIEINRGPTGAYAGPPACHGLFFDNPSQSYFRIADAATVGPPAELMFGALYGDLDYYLLLGDRVPQILDEFTRLTGRSAMPPRYAFGFHQGCYGYFDRARLEEVARRYREARIPLDGLHIDIDFQDNYRVFTHSRAKFPDAAGMLADLRARGFKCSTNVTPLVTDNPLDERGEMTPFRQREELVQAGGLLHDVRAGGAPAAGLFAASVAYGANRGVNPYRYPPLVPNRDGVTPLGARVNYPDLGRPEVRAIWARQYAHLIRDLGIDMIWQDMTCPAAAISADTPDATLPLDLMLSDGERYVPHAVCHNAYAMFLLEATHAALRELRPETRPFIVARGGYAGLQRYAALWTGDNGASWDFLRVTIPQVLALGLSGVPIAGSDVGGFATGPIPGGTTSASTVRNGRVEGGVTDRELFVRWMQAGAFLPWFRNHYIGYDKEYQEAYAYGEEIAGICRTWVERRYRLLQVFYDAMYEWTESGMPIVRALFLNDPEDPEVYRHLDDQFFLGRDILVAPVLAPAPADGPAVRDIYLPAGHDWLPFAGGPLGEVPLAPAIAGGQTLARVAVALDEVPVYVRAGAILPLRCKTEQYVGELADNPLAICIYPGRDSDYLLYQDDGISTQAERDAAFRTARIRHTGVPGGRRVHLQRLHDRFTPAEPFYFIRLLATPPPAAVRLNGDAVAAVAGESALALASQHGYAWDEATATTVVKVFDSAADVTIEVLFAA
jgi:alpha-glucosidase